jgi:competence protein ComGC
MYQDRCFTRLSNVSTSIYNIQSGTMKQYNSRDHTSCSSCLISGIQSSRTIQEQTCSHSITRVSYLQYTVKQNDTRTDMLTLTASGVLSPVYTQAEPYKDRHAHTHCLGCLISGIQSSRTIQEQTCSHSLPRVSYRRYTVKQNDTRTDMHTLTAYGVLSLEYSQAEWYKNRHAHTHCLWCLTSDIQSSRTIERYKNRHAHTQCLGCLTSDIQSSRTIQEHTCSHSMSRVSYLRYTVKQNDTITIMVIRHAPVVLPLVCSQAERYNNNHGHTTCPVVLPLVYSQAELYNNSHDHTPYSINLLQWMITVSELLYIQWVLYRTK